MEVTHITSNPKGGTLQSLNEEDDDDDDDDTIHKQVKAYCLEGWPPIRQSQPLINTYWEK